VEWAIRALANIMWTWSWPYLMTQGIHFVWHSEIFDLLAGKRESGGLALGAEPLFRALFLYQIHWLLTRYKMSKFWWNEIQILPTIKNLMIKSIVVINAENIKDPSTRKWGKKWNNNYYFLCIKILNLRVIVIDCFL